MRHSVWLHFSLVTLVYSSSASATFHLMQIEQVIGGVGGDPSAQAIQLRMRAPGQNLVGASRLRAWDSAGANPVLLIDFPGDVANGATGDRVLVTSGNFTNYTSPAVAPDFTMTAVIPVT